MPSTVAKGARRRRLRKALNDAGLLRPSSDDTKLILGVGIPPSARLGGLLESLGPMYAALREYLALRVDALPLADCHALADSGYPLLNISAGQAGEILQAELGEAAADLTAGMAAPERGNALFLYFDAILDDGTRLLVKLLRPALLQQWQQEAQDLQALERVQLPLQDGTVLCLRHLVRDFQAYIPCRFDLREQAADLQRMAKAIDSFSGFHVSVVRQEYSSSLVLCTEQTPGARLLATLPDAQAKNDLDIARRLSMLWFQQALLGRLYPIGALDDELWLLENNEVQISGGVFACLDESHQTRLLRYLVAAARDQDNQACEYLLSLCDDGTDPQTELPALQRQFRLAEPFRTGGWSARYTGQRLSDTLFVQWRLAQQNGYRFSPVLCEFAIGLYQIEHQCRRLAAERDGLRKGLDDVRVISAVASTRKFAGPVNGPENLFAFTQSLGQLMRQTSNDAELGIRKKPRTRKRQDHAGLIFAMFLIVACFGLVISRLLIDTLTEQIATQQWLVTFFAVAVCAFFWHFGYRRED